MDGITLSNEVIALLGVGAALLAAIVTGHVAQVRRSGQFPTREEMRAEIRAAEERLRQEMQAMEERLQQQIQSLHQTLQENTARTIDTLVSHRYPQPDEEPVFTRPA